MIPLPLVAVALAGGAGSIALQLTLDRASGRSTTERDIVEAGLIGVIPGVGMAKGVGTVGYRLHKGRKIVQAYKPGVKMHTVSNVGTKLGVGQSITSNISKREAYQNMLIYSALGGKPAARGMIASGVIVKSLDMIYGTKMSRPSTEAQRRKSSRKVGRRKTQKKPRTLKRTGKRCPPGYRYDRKLRACIRK